MLPDKTPKTVKPVSFEGGPIDGFKTYLEEEVETYFVKSDLEGYRHAYIRLSDGVFQYKGQLEVQNG